VAQWHKLHFTRALLVEKQIRLHAAAPLFSYLMTTRRRGRGFIPVSTTVPRRDK
jgi:hypothetical protein